MKITTALRSAIAQDLIAAMAAGSTNPNPVLEIYDGSIPASMGGAISNTLLATLTLTSTVGSESSGVITFDAITEDSSADATGTAGWARIVDRDGAEAVYLTVTASGGGGDIELNTTSVAAGAPVSINVASITVGGA